VSRHGIGRQLSGKEPKSGSKERRKSQTSESENNKTGNGVIFHPPLILNGEGIISRERDGMPSMRKIHGSFTTRLGDEGWV